MAQVVVTCGECGEDASFNFFAETRSTIADVEERDDSCGCKGKRGDCAQFDAENDALTLGEAVSVQDWDTWAQREELRVFGR
jgi:hypothetical protein